MVKNKNEKNKGKQSTTGTVQENRGKRLDGIKKIWQETKGNQDTNEDRKSVV